MTIDKAIEAYLREALKDFEKEESKHYVPANGATSWPQSGSWTSSLAASRARVDVQYHRRSNTPLERTAGSHSLAAAAHRQRSATVRRRPQG